MNRQELNKKSELDRLNVNSSQDTSSLTRGNLILPGNFDELEKKYSETTHIFLQVVSILTAILTFIFVPPLFHSQPFYDSLLFLFISLAASALIGLISFYLLRFIVIKFR